MQKKNKFLDKFFKIYILLVTFLLAVGLFYLNGKIDKLNSRLGDLILPTADGGGKTIDICGPDCQKKIESTVGEAVASLSGITKSQATPKPTSAPASQVSSKTQTTYIPLSGPITTTSTDWVDAVGTDVTIDVMNDYGKNAKISWDAFLSVANSNGQAYARLFDVTHGIAVDNSVLSVTDKSALTQVASGNLNFWSGKNVYRVQIKSLNSFTVTFGSGRIKVTY